MRFLLAALLCLPFASARADGFFVQTVFGQSLFYSSSTNQPFYPRGANYVRLASIPTFGHIYMQHVTLDPNFYDPARLSTALQQMAASGYNAVRFTLDCPFFWLTSQGMATAGISPRFLAVLEDALQRAASNNLVVLLSIGSVPTNYLAVPPGQVVLGFPNYAWGDNTQLFNPRYVAARGRFWADLLTALPQNYRDVIFSIDIYGEAHLDVTQMPFAAQPTSAAAAPTPGAAAPAAATPTAPDVPLFGNTYRMADFSMDSARGRQALADAVTVAFANSVTAAIKRADPQMLVTMSQSTPMQLGYATFDALRPSHFDFTSYPLRPQVLLGTDLDYLDIHEYPLGPGFSTDADLQAAGVMPNVLWPKPLVVSEIGVITADYATPATAAPDIAARMSTMCNYGFSGWVFWEWDTSEYLNINPDTGVPLYYAGETVLITDYATQAGGAINDVISPAAMPQVCPPIPRGNFIAVGDIAGDDGIFWSDGAGYYAYDNWADFLSLNGFTPAEGAAAVTQMQQHLYPRIPPTMPFRGLKQ